MHSPLVDISELNTCMIQSVDNGLLITSTGCTERSYSLTLYLDALKAIVATT